MLCYALHPPTLPLYISTLNYQKKTQFISILVLAQMMIMYSETEQNNYNKDKLLQTLRLSKEIKNKYMKYSLRRHLLFSWRRGERPPSITCLFKQDLNVDLTLNFMMLGSHMCSLWLFLLRLLTLP